MNSIEREARDFEIMKLWHAGIEPMTIAKRKKLTLSRVNQIIERERCRDTRKHLRAASLSRARAVKVKRS